MVRCRRDLRASLGLLAALALAACGTPQQAANEPGVSATATATAAAVAAGPSAEIATRARTTGSPQEQGCCADLERSVARTPEGPERDQVQQALMLCNALASNSANRAAVLQLLHILDGGGATPFPLPPGIVTNGLPLDCLSRASSAAPPK